MAAHSSLPNFGSVVFLDALAALSIAKFHTFCGELGWKMQPPGPGPKLMQLGYGLTQH